MIREPLKKNLSCLQVLKTLNVLLQGEYSMAEIVAKLNEHEKEPIFNNSVVSKYINTCRYSGVKVPKLNNRYIITSFPYGLKLSDREVDLLQKLKDVVTDEMSKKSCGIFQQLVDKLNRYADKKITPVEKKMYVATIESFEKALFNRQKIELMFKNRDVLKCIPVTIFKEKNKLFLSVFCKRRIRMVDVSRLTGIQVLGETFIGYMDELDVVFTLKKQLAKRYELREEERILQSSEEEKTISNKSRNTEVLLSRLMRYDDLCEIKEPADIRVQMKTMIDDTLKNYGID